MGEVSNEGVESTEECRYMFKVGNQGRDQGRLVSEGKTPPLHFMMELGKRNMGYF